MKNFDDHGHFFDDISFPIGMMVDLSAINDDHEETD